MSNSQRSARLDTEIVDVPLAAGADEVLAGAEYATPQQMALQRARERVARRLGAGRTPLPPDLGGGLFALATEPDAAATPTSSEAARPARALKSFVASFGDTPENRSSLSFLPPATTAQAEALTQKLDALFLNHAGSTDRTHDVAGMPIEERSYPNLVALHRKWRQLAQTALRVGALYRIRAEATPTEHTRQLLSDAESLWNQQTRLFEAAVDDHQEDRSEQIAAARQRWNVIQRLAMQLRRSGALAQAPAQEANPPIAPPGMAEDRQLAHAQDRLSKLDHQAHESAVADLVDRHPELSAVSNEPLTEELIQEYQSALATQRRRQPDRTRVAELVADLQAPVTELEARRCRRRSGEVRAFAEGLQYPKGKLSPREKRDRLEVALSQRGFGTRFGQSLPKLDRWMQRHLTGLSVLAIRKGRTYLRERIEQVAKMAPLTVLNLRDIERHLNVVAQAYEEASESLFEAAQHQTDALKWALRAIHSAEIFETQARSSSQEYDFRSTFPQSLRGVREDNPDATIPDATWVAALHRVWINELRAAQSEIRSHTSAIDFPVSPKTGRKVKQLDAYSERFHRDRLSVARRTIERVLADYRGRFGVEAARRFSDHLEWLDVPAVRDLPMNALPAERAARHALIFEWADRYMRMALFHPNLSQESAPGTAPQRSEELEELYEEERAEQLTAERHYRDEHGGEALYVVLRELRQGLAVRGCRVLPALPGESGALQSSSTDTQTATEDALVPLSISPPTVTAEEAGEPEAASDVQQEEPDSPAVDRPSRWGGDSEAQSAEPIGNQTTNSSKEPPVASTTATTDSPQDETANAASPVKIIWNCGLPDRSGTSQYTLLIRAPGDETFEKRRRGRKSGGQLEWKDALSPLTRGVWLEKIREVLTDGTPRTFNRIILEASGGRFTADIAAGKAPEQALWELHEQGHLEWANHPGGYVIWRIGQIAASSESQTAAAHSVSASPGLAVPEGQPAVQESLTTVRHVFASGMTRPVDMAGAIEAAHPFGVDVGTLSPTGRAGVIRAVRANVPVFVDSGAFRLFRENLGLTAAQTGQLAFLSGCGRGLNDDQVMKRYAGLVIELGRSSSVELGHLYLVAPDVVGNATETVRLLRKHRSLLTEFLDVGVNVIVPVQRDQQYSFIEMAESAGQILACANASHILGIPTHECAMQEEDLQVLLSRLRPPRIHLLGSAVAQTAGHRLWTVRQHNDETEVTMDGNLLRSRLDEIASLAGEARSSAIASLLVRATAGKQDVTAQAFMHAPPSLALPDSRGSNPNWPNAVSEELGPIDMDQQRAKPEPRRRQVPQTAAVRRPRVQRTSTRSGG